MPTRPEVREMYRNYRPPVKAGAIVSELLEYVPEKFLVGLDCVVLTNHSGLSRRDRLGKLPHRGRKVKKSEIHGLYQPRWKGRLPWIELYVDNILSVAGSGPLWVPLVRDFLFASVLYHEIGHHIHDEKRPEYKEKEDVADDYARRLGRHFLREKYGPLLPVLGAAAKTFLWFKRRKADSSRRSE